MPAQKNFSATDEKDDQLFHNPEAEEEGVQEDPVNTDEKDEDDVKHDEVEAENEEALEKEDSEERSQSESEFMDIELDDIRKDVQCPICLGIIKKTRTVMECLHRFCRACIDKSMRLGNNECPACRKHCASRRSLRDDPKFDAFIALLFKNIDRYEEKELALHEDEKARNTQIQVSIAQVSQRQTEALLKRRALNKKAKLPKSQGIGGSSSRRRRNYRNMENDTSEAHDDDGKDSSSDEEIQQRKRRKRSTTRSTAHPSSSTPNNDNANRTEEVNHRDSRGISPGLVWNQDILSWGKGSTRSNTRQGKSVVNARLNTLVEYLGSIESSNSVDIHINLISVDTKCIPNLPQPYLSCRPTLLVKQLREFVALQMQLKAEEVELLMTSSTEKIQSLKDYETLGKLKVDSVSSHEYLIVMYQKKTTA